jgi:TolA-binding protein
MTVLPWGILRGRNAILGVLGSLQYVLFSFTLGETLEQPPWMPKKSRKSSVYGTGCAVSSERAALRLTFGDKSKRRSPSETAMQLETVRSEIERMRTQVARQRGEIRQLQRAGIATASAEALLERIQNRIEELCAERDRLKRGQGPVKGRVLGGRSW